MALRNLPSSIHTRPHSPGAIQGLRESITSSRNISRVITSEGDKGVCVAYPYDETFFTQYGDFRSHCLIYVDPPGEHWVERALHPSIMVELMIYSRMGIGSFEEALYDDLYACAHGISSTAKDNIVDNVTDFLITTVRPFGFDYVYDLISSNRSRLMLADLQARREEDSMYYHVVST